jgi:aspartate/glutamate racemase
MRTVGVLGGMSGAASAQYNRRINAGINAHRGGSSAPVPSS